MPDGDVSGDTMATLFVAVEGRAITFFDSFFPYLLKLTGVFICVSLCDAILPVCGERSNVIVVGVRITFHLFFKKEDF